MFPYSPLTTGSIRRAGLQRRTRYAATTFFLRPSGRPLPRLHHTRPHRLNNEALVQVSRERDICPHNVIPSARNPDAGEGIHATGYRPIHGRYDERECPASLMNAVVYQVICISALLFGCEPAHRRRFLAAVLCEEGGRFVFVGYQE